MADDKLSLTKSSIQYQVHEAVAGLCSGAAKIRLIGVALESGAGEVFPNAPPEGLRQIAVVIKSHALAVVMSATDLVSVAERLVSLADIYDAADSWDE